MPPNNVAWILYEDPIQVSIVPPRSNKYGGITEIKIVSLEEHPSESVAVNT